MSARLDTVSHSLSGFIEWFRTGIAIALPALADVFYRPVYVARLLDANMTETAAHMVEQSFLGKRRIKRVDSTAAAIPTQLCLHSSQVHCLQLTLPAASSGRLAAAVELKLSEASPIMLEKAAYAYRQVGRDSKGGIIVDAALCRKSVVDDALDTQSSEQAVHSVAAYLDDIASKPFIFDAPNRNEIGEHGMGLLLIGGLIIALMTAATGVLSYTDRHAAAYEVHEREMIARLKADRRRLTELEQQSVAAPVGQQLYALSELTVPLKDTLETLPDGVIVSNINAGNGVLSVQALAPAALRQQLQDRFEASHFVRSDYEGYEQVSLTIMLERVQ